MTLGIQTGSRKQLSWVLLLRVGLDSPGQMSATAIDPPEIFFKKVPRPGGEPGIFGFRLFSLSKAAP